MTRRNLGGLAEYQFRHGHAGASSAAVRCFARAGKQHDIALHDAGKVVFDCRVNVGNVEGDSQTPRKGIKIAQVDLALPRHLQLTLEASGKLAHGDGHKDKEDQVDDFLRILDAEAVERRIEEKAEASTPQIAATTADTMPHRVAAITTGIR